MLARKWDTRQWERKRAKRQALEEEVEDVGMKLLRENNCIQIALIRAKWRAL